MAWIRKNYARNGRKTRDEAIREATEHFSHVKQVAQRELDAIAAGTIEVKVQRGWFVPTIVEVLEP